VLTLSCGLNLANQIEEQTLIPASEEKYWAEAFVTSGFESTIAIYQVKNGRRSLDRASRRVSQYVRLVNLACPSPWN
jgi:hypothetical protein